MTQTNRTRNIVIAGTLTGFLLALFLVFGGRDAASTAAQNANSDSSSAGLAAPDPATDSSDALQRQNAELMNALQTMQARETEYRTWQLALEGDGVQVTVKDSGQGIATADLAHIHKRFYRADKARSRHIPGVGLGLALVASIVNGYHGRFQVESGGEGQGTTVTIWWPLAQ